LGLNIHHCRCCGCCRCGCQWASLHAIAVRTARAHALEPCRVDVVDTVSDTLGLQVGVAGRRQISLAQPVASARSRTFGRLEHGESFNHHSLPRDRDTETRRHGDTETRDTETRRHGDTEMPMHPPTEARIISHYFLRERATTSFGKDLRMRQPNTQLAPSLGQPTKHLSRHRYGGPTHQTTGHPLGGGRAPRRPAPTKNLAPATGATV
jgi:hypothetical protein